MDLSSMNKEEPLCVDDPRKTISSCLRLKLQGPASGNWMIEIERCFCWGGDGRFSSMLMIAGLSTLSLFALDVFF